jgi:hypothetical protein
MYLPAITAMAESLDASIAQMHLSLSGYLIGLRSVPFCSAVRLPTASAEKRF